MQGHAEKKPGLNFDLTILRLYRDHVLFVIQRLRETISTFVEDYYGHVYWMTGCRSDCFPVLRKFSLLHVTQQILNFVEAL